MDRLRNLANHLHLNSLSELPLEKPNPKNFNLKKWLELIVMVSIPIYSGKQTPKGPDYNVTDKFAYNKGPEWKIGSQPRNTLDTKAKY